MIMFGISLSPDMQNLVKIRSRGLPHE